MIILPINVKKFNSHLFYDCGLDSINTRYYVDIKNLAKTINYVDVLPEIYAYTGCDYIPAFYQKGKVRPFALMLKHLKYLDVISSFEDASLEGWCVKSMEEFTCALYGYSSMTNLVYPGDKKWIWHFKKTNISQVLEYL